MKITYGYWPAPNMQEERLRGAFEAMKRDVKDGRANYVNLPFSRNHLSAAIGLKEEIGPITDLVVCGMGGSSLGAKALLSIFGPAEGVRIHILDTIEPEVVNSLFSSLNMKTTIFNVVTKSGKTLETLAMLDIVLQNLEKNGLKPERRLIVTTAESDENELHQWAENRGIRTLPFPHGVEGRYSVLSAVGLFPALYMDCRPEEILRGAERQARQYFSERNESLLFASKSVAAMEAGMTAHVFFSYSAYLKDTGDWFAQLWAESLGKNGKGQVPVTAVGPAAQHSQLQLYLDGPKNNAITLVGVEEHESKPYIGGTGVSGHLPKGLGLSEILHAEMKATAMSLTEKEVLNRTIVLKNLREVEIGELFMFLEMATAYACYLSGVNPYDQPAVEAGKKHTREILSI